MEHRCLEHHYTKLDTSLQISIYIDNSHIPMTDVPPSQLSRNALNTVTPDLAHLITDIYIYIYLTLLLTCSGQDMVISH